MKIFRLVNAELRKIFLRPTIFIMIALLVLVSFISLIAFNPDKKTTDSTVITEGSTVSAIYNNFMQTSSSSTHTTKFDLDAKLNEALQNVENFTHNDNVLFELRNLVGTGQESTLAYDELKSALETASRPNPAIISPSDAYRTANLALSKFKNALAKVIIQVGKFANSDKYYLTTSKFDEVKSKLEKLDNVVKVYNSNQKSAVYSNELEAIKQYDYDNLMSDFIDNLTAIKIDEEIYQNIKTQYYEPAISFLGDNETENTLTYQIYQYYVENAAEGGQEYIENFQSLLSDYKAYINMTCENLNCAIQLEVGKDKSDIEMQTYVGYTNYNALLLSSNLSKNAFMINNNINPRTTLESLSFGVNSGNETNAWDFIAFSMNITSLLIIIFCVLISSKIIAGEQTGGTMKLLAIRPFTRNKILGGKLLATMFFSMIFVCFSFIVSFGIGWAFYGLPHQMMIGVFNGSSVIYTHPIVFCLFLILSLFLKVFIYVSIATMISVLFRSYTGSSMISFAIVIVTLILNGVLATKSWFKYFPMANFDLYKYFTTSQSATGFKAIFTSPLIIDTSFVFSLLYSLGIIIILNLISFVAFKRKDIA